MSQTGRPTAYTDECGDAILGMIAEGKCLTEACAKAGIHRSTFYRWLDAHPSLRDGYARARSERADWYADQIVLLAAQCAAGEIDPHAARTSIDALKWVASRLNPRSWGDRQDVNVAVRREYSDEELERFAAANGLDKLCDAIPE